MSWLDEVVPVMTELAVLPDLENEEALKQVLHWNIQHRFVPLFGRRLGGVLVLSRAFDTAFPLLALTYPMGLLHFLYRWRVTPHAQRKAGLMFGSCVLAGVGPRYCLAPVMAYSAVESCQYWGTHTGTSPVDLNTQRKILAMVNAAGEDPMQGLLTDLTIKYAPLFGFLFSATVRPTNSLLTGLSVGLTLGMTACYGLRSWYIFTTSL